MIINYYVEMVVDRYPVGRSLMAELWRPWLVSQSASGEFDPMPSRSARAGNLEWLLRDYVVWLKSEILIMLAIGLAAVLLYFFVTRSLSGKGEDFWAVRHTKWISATLLLSICLIGLYVAIGRASVIDDAYISFRYAKNLAEGNGLVYNIGQRVEGYTNFLWTLLIALFLKTTPLDAPMISIVLSLTCFVGNLVVAFAIGRKLARSHGVRVYFPVAAALLAVQSIFCLYATTGMETSMGCLFVSLGTLLLISSDTPRSIAGAGIFFILATLTHPDNAIFYGAGGLAVLYRILNSWRDIPSESRRQTRRASLIAVAAYAAPFFPYLGYLVWKVSYYGSLLPNTYYAKEIDQASYHQGAIYAGFFYLGSHLWVALLFLVPWIILRSPDTRTRTFKVFALISIALVNFYVLRIGGDFMLGRFYIALLPMLLLSAEQLICELHVRWLASGSGRLRIATLIAVGSLAATAGGVEMIPPREIVFGIAEEPTFYPVLFWHPLVIDHYAIALGKFLRHTLTDRGIRPTIGIAGIGMVGYYSELPLIDLHGLTDPMISHSKPTHARPGHRKWPTLHYLCSVPTDFECSGVGFNPDEYRDLCKLRFDGVSRSGSWEIIVYDRALMREMKARVPEIHFLDFESYLDTYIATLHEKPVSKVAEDLVWFEQYYFNHNDDQIRHKVLSDYAKPQLAASGASTKTGK